MSFMFRDRKEADFDYGSTFCPYKDGCSARNCGQCHVFESEFFRRKKDSDLENYFASGL